MKNLVVGMLEIKEKFENSSLYATCCEGKQSRLPFKHQGTRDKEILEVIHADLWGSMETA